MQLQKNLRVVMETIILVVSKLHLSDFEDYILDTQPQHISGLQCS